MNKDKRASAQTELVKPYKNFSVGTPLIKSGIFEHPTRGYIAFPDPNSIKLILEIARKNIEAATIFLKKIDGLLIDITSRMGQVTGKEGKHIIHTKECALKKVSMLRADEKEHFDFFENCITGVTFCYTALECFVNLTIPDDYLYHYEERVSLFNFKFLKIKKRRSLSRDDRRLDLSTKLGIILPEILGVKTPKGEALWERYVNLKKLRDKIVHFKKRNLTRVRQDEFNESLYAEFLSGGFIDVYDQTIKLIEYYYRSSKKPSWLEE
ncbi:hypothetical protein KKD80_03450 [Patescibacteria group bacterium]|nr:hypothetical protein [Patescibacteria group bacterium]